MKINILNIPETTGHNNSVYKKQLISLDHRKRLIATMNYAWLKKRMKLEPHIHMDGEEHYIFLKGTGIMSVGNDVFEVVENDYVIVPKQILHSLVNNNEQYLCFLTLRTLE